MKILSIRLIPKASSSRIGEIKKLSNSVEQLTVYVTDPPEKGKANKAMIRLLSKYLKVPPSALTLIKGEKSQNKLVRICGK